MTLAIGQSRQGDEWRVTSGGYGIRRAYPCHSSRVARHPPAFTLIELILVLALIVIAVSLAAPALSGFVRGQALDSEARRLLALAHAGQARAVSEAMPMMLWLDEAKRAYGLEAETTGKDGDAKAENLAVDENVQLAVLNAGATATTTFKNLPAIRFLADGTVDENSPQTLRLLSSTGSARWLVQARDRSGYEIRDTDK
jgi:type II secretion system protein H